MFTFNFLMKKTNEDNEKRIFENKEQLNWFSSRIIDIPQQYQNNLENINYISNTNFFNFPLKLIDIKEVLIKLTKENYKNIIDAESQNSDLIPAKYEGGLKVWESTYDLGNYIISEQIPFKNKFVLDLGCGAGIIGIIALLQGSLVHFQDYNVEVIESFTIPNVLLNSNNYKITKEKCKFYGGDWESFGNLLINDNKNKKYDFIFTSETIYNPDNYHKLYQIFKKHLSKNGLGFIAGKTYYFGVGGCMRQFEKLVLTDNLFDVKIVWKSNEGLQREILKLKRKQMFE